MKRLVDTLVHAYRVRNAIRAYRHCSRRTTELTIARSDLTAELRAAIEAETAAAERMEQLLNSN
jgi:hypothetical protein